ncbi:hypothetical protein [Nannocystis exedens]|uniref:hypothetical protein n=1 Tax=Nannocystis exedens TaxID=54 RepID=UPI000C2B2ACF|nr:hypothetical protein [Nannocystis exedens]
MTTVERIRRQFQEALEGLEMRLLLERLEQNLSSLSLKEFGELLKSPVARTVGDVPASVLLNQISKMQANTARSTR